MKRLTTVPWLPLALSLATGLAACETGEVVGPLADAVATEDQSIEVALTTTLALDQSGTGGIESLPGTLWHLAARLHESLSEREKARLYRWADSLKTLGLVAECRVILQNRDRNGALTGSEAYPDDVSDRIQARLQERLIMLRDSLDRGLLSRTEFQRFLQRLQERARVRLDSARVRIQNRFGERPQSRQARYERCAAAVGDAMASTLGLNDDQLTQIANIDARLTAERERLREQLRGGELTREEYRRLVARTQAAAYGALSAVFDETQLEIARVHFALVWRFRNGLVDSTPSRLRSDTGEFRAD